MICGMEIGLAIFGLLALIRGRMTVSKTKVVVGIPARLLGLLALTPLPVAAAVVAVFAIVQGQGDPDKIQRAAEDNRLTLSLIEAGIVIGTAVLVFVIAAIVGIHPSEAERRARAGRYEEDEYDDEEYEDARDRRRGRDRDDADDDRDDRRRDRPRDDRDDDRDDRRSKPWQR